MASQTQSRDALGATVVLVESYDETNDLLGIGVVHSFWSASVDKCRGRAQNCGFKIGSA
jgi:hypothetical protein